MTLDVGKNRLKYSLHISVKGNEYGIGHVSRQKNLSLYAMDLGWICKELILNQSESPDSVISGINSIITKIDIVFLDLDPRYIKLHRTSILNLLHLLKLNKCKIAFFDIDQDFSLNRVLEDFDFDFVFCPYANLGIKRNGRYFSGFGLSIFPPNLDRVRNSRLQRNAAFSDVLISCGGSDPFGISLIYLETLEEILPTNSSIIVIVGEKFDKNLVIDLINFYDTSKLNIQIIRAPSSITEYLEVSKFVLTTGGLTRIESIYAGVPAMVVDIDQGQYNSTKLFVEHGAMYGLGLAQLDDFTNIKSNLRKFLAEIETNSEILPMMSHNARLTIDRNGANFILKEIDNYV